MSSIFGPDDVTPDDATKCGTCNHRYDDHWGLREDCARCDYCPGFVLPDPPPDNWPQNRDEAEQP